MIRRIGFGLIFCQHMHEFVTCIPWWLSRYTEKEKGNRSTEHLKQDILPLLSKKKKKNKKTYPSLSHTDKIQVNCFIYNLLQYVLWVPSLATHAYELLLLFLEWHAYELWFSEGIKMVECLLKLLGWNVVSSVLPPLG